MNPAEAVPHIPILHAVVLGIVQGLSEFLPISSSGHLVLVPWLFGWDELDRFPELKKTFDVALHVGTFLAALVYFRKDVVALVAAAAGSLRRRALTTARERLVWLLVLSTVPGALAGALLQSFIEEELGDVWLVAVMLIGFALVLYVADRSRGARNTESFGARDALVMGAAQALALQPGVSRSGITISAGRWLAFERDAAARLSFLMSLPITGAAALYSGLQLARDGMPPGMAGAFVWGTVASAATGFMAVWTLMRLIRSRSFTPFVVYRLGAGVLALSLLAIGFR